MKFTLFHLMPYADLGAQAMEGRETTWVHLPNLHFDPEKGHRLYNRYLDELEYAEPLGFDGIAVNEHHQTAYGLMPSPAVTASALARRTGRVKIAILGNALPLRANPLTVAEEHAMIDCITGGRLISGFVRGIGAEYHTFDVNPTESHARYGEAHDLIVAAWTRPGPFEWRGKHFRLNYVNPWPRPYQQPHPPIWVPSQGSQETIDWAAHPDRKYTYLQTFSPAKAVEKYLRAYRETAEGYGYTATDDQLGWAVPIYVGETDAKAHEEAKPHFEVFRNTFLKMPLEMLLPPGYSSLESMRRIQQAKAQVTGDLTLEKAVEMGMMVCGSAETVQRQLADFHGDMRFGHLLCMMQFGTLPHDLTLRSMERFAERVMPALRAEAAPEARHVTAV
jgi:alkanesulfonate monooxygenase SsuD/methylene tetrahydromethanopterin reductase-like flavin-dependent oxidoreductase (luciferase family)